jgi:hypothetical protein
MALYIKKSRRFIVSPAAFVIAKLNRVYIMFALY